MNVASTPVFSQVTAGASVKALLAADSPALFQPGKHPLDDVPLSVFQTVRTDFSYRT